MPRLTFSQIFSANQIGVDLLENWQYRYAPYAAAVKILLRSTTVGNRMTVFAGSTAIQQRSPVPAGGTIGVPPTEFTVTPVTFLAAAGDLLQLVCDEVAGGTPTIDGSVEIEPL